jgi:glycylpeptide N-tetradecanoyltransferase
MPSQFWNTQPVDKGDSKGTINHKPVINLTPTPLPPNFFWSSINDIPTICKFLENFYVEDTNSHYRLSYSTDFFEFLFNHPSHKIEYSLGLFYNQTLIGYILAREHDLCLLDSVYPSVSINFLCIDKEFRNKSFAPVLIKEITRIANLNGIFKAIFTAEKDYGFSIGQARYFHFPIKSETLLKANIIDFADEVLDVPQIRDDTIVCDSKATCDENDSCDGTFRSNGMSKVLDIYNKTCFDAWLHEKFNLKIFYQIFSGKKDVLTTIYNLKTEEFASFFIVNTKCIESDLILKRAYLYYWAGSSKIISDAIGIANKMNVDMFDILNIGKNSDVIRELGFLEGSGSLKYHLFNLKEKALDSSEINFILFYFILNHPYSCEHKSVMIVTMMWVK